MVNLNSQRHISLHRTGRLIALLWLLVFLVAACSDQRSSTTAPHPLGFLTEHSEEANADLEGCKVCHGADFSGSQRVVSCFACHLEGPPFGIHPAAWAEVSEDHRTFAETLSWTTCAVSVCHGSYLRGGTTTGSSCFLAECHQDGPAAPHPVLYAAASDHGPAAKPEQLYCRNCHGRPTHNFSGGLVSDPLVLNKPSGSCSTWECHPAAPAHPTNWQGTNEDRDPAYDSSHRGVNQDTMQSSCALCHKVYGPGIGPLSNAPSCFSTHFTNTDNSTTVCHGSGPGVPHPLPFAPAAFHGPEARRDLSYCQQCHGIPGTIQFEGGTEPPGCSTSECHPAAGAHPTRWEGENDITPTYRSNHRNSENQIGSCTICHDFILGRTPPNSNSPSCFAASFTNADGTTNTCHPEGPDD